MYLPKLCPLLLAISLCAAEAPIADRIKSLRAVPDARRGAVTRQIANDIDRLPASPNKLLLAHSLAHLSTEGDFGQESLNAVGTALADALREQEASSKAGMAEEPWVTLAQLIRYEHVNVTLQSPLLTAAMARLQSEEQRRAKADFTLTDLKGRQWKLSDLHGQVVLVNFWATWCPPCRKEMPDLDALYRRFSREGLVILAISDEQMAKVKPFVAKSGVSYPVLLDPESKVNKLMDIDGIPKSFVYDRDGKIVAQAIDMRTRNQFLAMLAKAGLK